MRVSAKKMRLHYLQHVPFEDLGCIEKWAIEKEHTLTSTHLYADDNFPDVKAVDWLVIMGGPAIGKLDPDVRLRDASTRPPCSGGCP